MLAVAGWFALFAPDRRVDVLSLALPLVLLRLFDLVALSDVEVIVTKFVKITKVLIRRVDSNQVIVDTIDKPLMLQLS